LAVLTGSWKTSYIAGMKAAIDLDDQSQRLKLPIVKSQKPGVSGRIKTSQ
jgi:hypothetical protein